ncbi:unnamed protein product [Sphagnum jensenii]
MTKRRSGSRTTPGSLSRESASFDSRPLKVGNRPEILICRRRATYRWKALDESYNFASDRTSIRGLLAKLWGFKVPGVPQGGISGLPAGSPGKKSHLDVVSAERRREYYKGEGGGFPQVRAVEAPLPANQKQAMDDFMVDWFGLDIIDDMFGNPHDEGANADDPRHQHTAQAQRQWQEVKAHAQTPIFQDAYREGAQEISKVVSHYSSLVAHVSVYRLGRVNGLA